MYKGFELKILSSDLDLPSCCAPITYYKPKPDGVSIISGCKNLVKRAIHKHLLDATGTINGNEIENLWFPKNELPKFQVFLSHSHNDEALAMTIAEILQERLHINVFIDSLVWGFRDNLIDLLYQNISLNKSLGSKEIYLSICAHVDCMLTKSLIEMMDSCECLLFLNTPTSVSAEGSVKRTHSPWIYAELEASRFLRSHFDATRTPTQRKQRYLFNEKQSADYINIDYNLPQHLNTLSPKEFKDWLLAARDKSGFEALDVLYRLGPIASKTTML